MTTSLATGSLYIVATPIGNREDISLRAIEILKNVDFIIAEDTRHSLPLLNSLGINKHLTSLHAYNETGKSKQLISLLLEGKSAALISDAGTPLISDPGYPLVKLAREENIPVIPIPGPCAFIAALSAAGVPCDTITFAGFLPSKSTARVHKLKELALYRHTVVFYESTHRIKECLETIREVFGNDEIVLAKELTKTYECFLKTTAQEIINWLESDPAHCKGEFVLIIPPRPEETDTQESLRILKLLMEELPLKQAVKVAALLTDENKNDLYKTALALQTQK